MGYQCPLFNITILAIIIAIIITNTLDTVNCLNGSNNNNGKIILLNDGDENAKGFRGNNIWSILKEINVYSNSLIINWIIKCKESIKLKIKFEWIIKLRKFGTNEINKYYFKDELYISPMKLVYNYTYLVKNLQSSTGYEICIESENYPIEDKEKRWLSYKLYDNKFNKQNNLSICKEILTENDKSAIVKITIIIIVTSLTTALVIFAVIWCYFRIKNVKNRKKNMSKYVSCSYSKSPSFLSPSSSSNNNNNELKNYTKIYKWTDDKEEDGSRTEDTNVQNSSGNDNQSSFKDIKGSLKIFYQPKTSFRKNRMGSITKFTKNHQNKRKKSKDRFLFNEKFVNFDFKTFEDTNKERNKKELKSTL